MNKFSGGFVGKSPLRAEGPQKISGRAKYIDDYGWDALAEGKFNSGLYGVTVRSTVPRGKIKSIEFLEGVNWEEFTIVSAKDLISPFVNRVAMIFDDQPFLAEEEVNHPEEPILLLAHSNLEQAKKARQQVKINYQERPPVFSLQESKEGPQVWPPSFAKTLLETAKHSEKNVFKKYQISKGNLLGVFSSEKLKTGEWIEVNGTFSTGAQEQLYIEPNGIMAYYSGADSCLEVMGSLQCPYYVHKGLTHLFGLPDDQVRVIQAETGGGFGGKEEYPTLIAAHAALLSWKSGLPVKMIYDRAEDLLATTKRHPSESTIKAVFSRDGKLQGLDILFEIDGGAYATLSTVVLSRGTIHAPGPYSCENIRVISKAYATNTPPHGAFRGFGAPQSIFAMERFLDHAANILNISPIEIRERNFLKKGQKTATGQIIHENLELQKICESALKKINYSQKLKEYKEWNSKNKRIKKGVGFATFMHGSGFTGSGERYLASQAGIQISPKGKIEILSANTEIGQGTNTVFSQIVADALKCPLSSIEVVRPDTKMVPNSGPTVASRTVMVVGRLVERAAQQLKKEFDLYYPEFFNEKECTEPQEDDEEYSKKFENALVHLVEKKPHLRKILVEYQPAQNIFWDDETYSGDAYGAYAWATYAADVELDTLTGIAKVKQFVASQEIGKVVHPVLAEGQIEGGVLQGIGFALYEKVIWDRGRMLNHQLTNYIIPTAQDAPPMDILFFEWPMDEIPQGPQGAKGIGELPMDGPAPAIMNALGSIYSNPKFFNFVPCMPEDIMQFQKEVCS